MSIDDLEFAVEVTRTMNWNLGKDDFLFMMELEPEGCFVLADDGEKIGLATNVSYGPIAWFGNLIVDQNHRVKGGGSMLVKHSLSYLQKKGVFTLGLYAYIDKIPFYERLGFRKDAQYIVFQGIPQSSRDDVGLMRAKASEEFRDVICFDSKCFGASREKSLGPIISDSDNQCYIHRHASQLDGYVVAKVGAGRAEIGPLVCSSDRNDLAIDLLKKMLGDLQGKETTLFVPEREKGIIATVERSGLHEKFGLARMFFGKPLVDRCLCLPESLERG